MLNPFKAEMIYHTRREEVQDFYDVWLFHADIDISEIKMQETEVVGVQWANRLSYSRRLITKKITSNFIRPAPSMIMIITLRLWTGLWRAESTT